MSKKSNKKAKENLIKLSIATNLIALIAQLIELIEKLIR